MNKLFKISLLAAAAAVAAAGAANAGTFTLTKALYSAEGIELLSAAEQNAAADIKYFFDTDYEAGATLTFTFSDGAIADSTVFPPSVLTKDLGANGVAESTALVTAAADAADLKTAADALKKVADTLKIAIDDADLETAGVVETIKKDAQNAELSVGAYLIVAPDTVKNAAMNLTAAFDLPSSDPLARAHAIITKSAALKLATDTFATTATNAANTAAALVDDDPANVGTFTKSTTTANSVTYMLTAKASGTKTLANSFFVLPGKTDEIDGLAFNTAAIKAGAVTVTASAEYQGVAFDPDTTTKEEANKDKNQLAATATQFGKFAVSTDAGKSFDGVIALTADNELAKELTDTNDNLVVTYTPLAGDKMPAFAVIGVVADALDNDLSATKLTTAYEVVGQLPGFSRSQLSERTIPSYKLYETAKGLKIILEAGNAPIGAELILETNEDKNDALVVQHFSVIPTIKYNDVVITRPALAAGNWTINAETVNIPYMPYGAAISQIIYATNSSAVDAQVSATAVDENGMSYALGVVGTANGNGAVTKLSGGVNAALAAQGFTKGKVSIDLLFAGVASVDDTTVKGDSPKIGHSDTLILPKGAIKVQSAYNVKGADRGFVANSTNDSNGCDHCTNDLPDDVT